MASYEKITMTPEQEAWMRKHFKNTKNDVILAKFGWSHSTMHRFAREMGLTKTKQYMKKCQAYTTACAKESHLRNGTYPPKGYIIPRSEEFRFKPGPHKETKAEIRKRVAKATETMKQIRKEERARISWGVHQQTKLRLISVPRRVICQRCRLRKMGYIVERGSMIAYYDENTRRCPKMEARKIGDNKYSAFVFKPLPI